MRDDAPNTPPSGLQEAPSGLPRLSPLSLLSLTLYDFANTAFSVIVVTVIYSRYFTNTVAGGSGTLWGAAVAVSMLITLLISPPLGAAADSSSSRKRFLLGLTLLSVVCTALLSGVHEGMVFSGMGLFILANVGFEGGIVFYDSFLPRLAPPGKVGRISGYGYAMGYVGALASLLIVLLVLTDPADPGYLDSVRSTFLVAAGFFLLFSIPMFLFVPEPHASQSGEGAYIRKGFQRARETVRSLFGTGELRNLRRFFLSFFLYNDAIVTIIAFAAIFAENTLGMGDTDIIIFFAIVQTSAVAGSFVFGFVTDRIGPKRTIMVTLILWIFIAGGAVLVETVATFYIIALSAGLAIGATQSASRSLMAGLTPPGREAEFFAFYHGPCGKGSAILGPLLFGALSDLAGQRAAVGSLAFFFAAGLWLMVGVESPASGRMAPEGEQPG